MNHDLPKTNMDKQKDDDNTQREGGCSPPACSALTGNPWFDHAGSFEQADMLRLVRKQVRDGDVPSMADIERIVGLAIQAHDAMSIIGGGELIDLGPLPSAILEIAGTGSDKEQANGLFKQNVKGD